MQSLPELRLICVAATRADHIDVDFARNQGILVRNVSAYSIESVAQFTFAMLLHLLHHLSQHDAYVKSGAYGRSGMFTHIGPPFWELSGKRMGIVGLGNIGRRVAKISEGCGMEVVFYSTTGRNNNINYKRFDLDTLLSTSDVISIHAPYNQETKDLITLEKMKKMRPCAIILNTGRGGIINEKDLADALNDGVIAAAGLDVFTSEPISADHPLLSVREKDRLLLTPHTAWSSTESRTRLIEGIARNIEQYQREKYT
jgi:glycerate dehydrogenase